MSLQIAHVFYHSDGGMELEKDIFPTVKSQGYFLATELYQSVNTYGELRSTKQLLILDDDAIRHFCNWGCKVKILKSFYPKQYVNPYVFYLPMNDLYDQNPNLTEAEVAVDLLRMMDFLIDAQVLKFDDFRLSVHFKKYTWYALINFKQELSIDSLAFTHRWLIENIWTLPNIKQTVSVRYGTFDAELQQQQQQSK